MKKLTVAIAGLAIMAFAAAPAFACDEQKTTATTASATTNAKACTVSDKAACGATTTTAGATTTAGMCCASADKMAMTTNACCDEKLAAAAAKEMNYTGKVMLVNMSVKGMTCGGCASSVSAALAKMDGVVKVCNVDYKSGIAKVVVDPTRVKSEALATLVTAKGYQSEIIPAVATTVTGAKTGSCSADKSGCTAKAKEATATTTSVNTPQ